MYGKDANIDIGMQAEKELIIENADLLTTSKDKMKPPSLFNTNSQSVDGNEWKDTMRVQSIAPSTQPIQSTTITQSATSSPNKPILKQIETRTTDGKRRITPMFIPIVEETAASVTSAEPFSSSSRSGSTIVIEKVESPEIPAKVAPVIKAEVVERNILDSRLQKPASNAPVKSNNILQSTPSTSGPPSKIARLASPMVRMKAGQAAPLKVNQQFLVKILFLIHFINI